MSKSILMTFFLLSVSLGLGPPATRNANTNTATSPPPAALSPAVTGGQSKFVSDVNGVGASHICPNETWPQPNDPHYEELLNHASRNIDDMEVDRGATQ